MRVETIKCENLFTGEEEEVTLYFHLTEAELIILNAVSNNKYGSFNENDPKNTIASNVQLFEEVLKKAIGRKSENGEFIKNDQIRDAFLCSPAYSILLGKIISEEIKIDQFILDCLPRNVARQIEIKDGKPVVKALQQENQQ